MNPFSFGPFSRSVGCVLVIAALCFPGRARAQEAVAAPSRAFAQVDASATLPTDAGNSEADANVVVEPHGQHVGDTPRRFTYSFSLTVRGVSDDNINISSFNKQSDYYFAIEPTITFGLGAESDGFNSLSFAYRPSFYLFDKYTNRDSVQQIVHLAGSHQFGHIILTLTEDIQLLDGQDLNTLSDPTGHQANTDVGARARQQVYATSLGYSYDISTKLFVSGTLAYVTDQYQSGLISSDNFTTNIFLNYIYSPKLTVGLGGTGGYNTTSTSNSTDQTFQQVNFRLNYAATAKINLSGSVGIEFRQTGGYSSDPSPVFELTAAYAPFDGTSISLNGHRRTENSAVLAGQDFSETAINFAVQQRFFQRVYVGLSVGYINSGYFSTVQGLNATRSDDYYYIEPTVDMNVTRFWSVGAYFLHREDSSTFAFYSFDDNQFGIRSTLTF